MANQELIYAFPNEQWEIILEFADHEYRIFKVSILCDEMGWSQLAYPQHYKRFELCSDGVVWHHGGKVDADFLFERSSLIAEDELQYQSIRLGYKNQAPTSVDQRHHVYSVSLAPHSSKPFIVGESIGGGHFDRGYDRALSLPDLLSLQDWTNHFTLSGCSWAVSMIQSNFAPHQQLMRALISEASLRNGMPENLESSRKEMSIIRWIKSFAPFIR